jgi:hypothetical protein
LTGIKYIKSNNLLTLYFSLWYEAGKFSFETTNVITKGLLAKAKLQRVVFKAEELKANDKKNEEY